ncbi:MAG: nucleotidyltransferase domain-containing protein [Patescibacteria group bacterium]|nr:nucleotidyltransferase domain-containing protein [Patescibacteria group bacterium]
MALETQDAPLTLDDVELVLHAPVGSVIQGLNVDDTTDRDEMAVCIEPPEWVIGLKHFEQIVKRSRPQGVRSQPGDLDLTVYGLRKFCSLALKGNPSILLLFQIPQADLWECNDVGLELRNLAWAFASKRAGAAFLGYMQQQRQRLMGERGQMNVKRPELVEQFGYDTKYAGHILRLGWQGIEYMTRGAFSVPMPKEQCEFILSVRRGQVPEQAMLTRAGELEAELKDAIDSTWLPDTPDHAAVNRFLIRAYPRTWWN